MKKRDFRSHKNHSEMGEAEPTGDEEDRALPAPAYQLMENMDKGFGAYHVVADSIFLRRNTSE